VPVTVSVTPLAKKQVTALRRTDRAAYDQFLQELSSQGCKALGYRLTGDVVEHLCVKHLVRALRVVVAFTAEDEATVVIVGQHDDDDPRIDVYTLLYELAGLERPPTGRAHETVLLQC
jgi:mRNA-degrading endonuclease RelE of RelBE toxin-antitoxin system